MLRLQHGATLTTQTLSSAGATQKTAIYLRISEDRVGLALGVERQREDCLGLCSVRGRTDPEIFQDNDLTATKGGLSWCTRPSTVA
jgi:hypothetical protein